MIDLPKVALSIRQPWAWLIVQGFKDIENRDWATKFRGPVLIHAGKAWDKETEQEMLTGDDPAGRLATVDAVSRFRAEAESQPSDAFAKLRGKNLACWCKPGEPCHADVLLELANR